MILGELESVEACVRAVRKLRGLGLRAIDVYSPYPSMEIERALEIPRSTIARNVLLGGVLGVVVGFGIQYYLNGFDYPLNVGGRPLLSAPAFIPITFETTILFAALFAFISFFAKVGLPELSHPLFSIPGFERATIDRFWISVDTTDPLYDFAAVRAVLEESGATKIIVYRSER